MHLALIEFPNFNIYSTPLLVLVLQGLIFSILLLGKYKKTKALAYFFLASILLITCFHRTTYTIGFMDWYDTFPNTKVNYYLISFGLALGPLIYFYVKSVTQGGFRFERRDYLHFSPVILYVIFKLFVLGYDASQPGFDDVQNGYMVENFLWPYLEPIATVISTLQMLLYLAFTFQLYYGYRRQITHFFSNTYSLELNWLQTFLWIYSFLYVYGVIQITVDIMGSFELSWTQKWWLQFFNALAIIYVGVKGYFTDTERLTVLQFVKENSYRGSDSRRSREPLSAALENKKNTLTQFMEAEKPYLEADLTLITLSRKLNYSRAELSEIINSGFALNFNDYINSYRVAEVKTMLEAGKQTQLSLLGIALDCGFNSKATFNRAFKKQTGLAPTSYAQKIEQ